MNRLSVRLSGIKLNNRIQFRPKSLTYLLLTAFFVVGGFYIYEVNAVANKGADLNTLYQKNKELSAENERYATEAARLASLKVIDQGATGEVQPGNQESAPAATPNGVTPPATTTTPTGGVQAQEVTLMTPPPAKPKMVLTQKQTYLHSYGTSLAQR